MTVSAGTVLCLIVISSIRCQRNEPTRIPIPLELLKLYESLGGSRKEILQNSRVAIHKSSISNAVIEEWKNGMINDVQIVYANNSNSREVEFQVPQSLDLNLSKKLIANLAIDCERNIGAPITIKYVLAGREYAHTTKNSSDKLCEEKRIIKFNISPVKIAILNSGSRKGLMKVRAIGPFGSSPKLYPQECYLAIYSLIPADKGFGSGVNPSVGLTSMSQILEGKATHRKCQPQLINISFSDDLKWDFIIAPPSIETKYCSGKCPWILPDHYQPTMAAIIQSQMHSAQPRTIPGLCCVPNKFKNNPIIYMNEDWNACLHVYTDMVVSECGCK